MPLTDADAGTVWDFKNPTLDKIDMRQRLVNAETNSAAAVSALAALKTQLTALQQSVSGVDADVKTTAASVLAAIAAGVQVTLTGDQVSEIESRLASALPGYTVNITPAAPPSA